MPLSGCESSRSERKAPVTENIAPTIDGDRVDASKQRLERFILNHYERGFFPSFAVGVFNRSGFVYTYYINSNSSKKYSTGSVTKLLTATLFQMQLERNRLQPHETIDRYFPEFQVLRWNNEPITVLNLVTHTGGFPDLRYYKNPEYRKIDSIDLKVPMPIYPPGRHYRYSNHGYIMLGHILEKVCEDSIANCIRREIFEPLGMTDSSGPTTGAGGFVTTLHDLMLFGRLYLNEGTADGRILLSKASIQQMLQPGFYIPNSDHQFFTGRGWRVKTDRTGVVTMFHIGGANYTSAWLQLFPRYRVGICYLGNPSEYSDPLMNYLSGVQYLLGDVAGAYVNSPGPVYAWKADPPDPELASQYPGVYIDRRTSETLMVFVKKYADQEHLMIKGPWTYEIFPETHQVFNGGRNFLSHQFVVDPPTGKVIALANGSGYYEKQFTAE
jgi:CubicO group peptidase (beta-lactamase class C family)